MRTSYYTSFALLVASTVLLAGCFDEVAGPYEGSDRVGFAQYQTTGEFGATVADGSGTVSVPAQLIGPQRGSSFEVSVSVQPDTVFREREVAQGDGTDTTVVDVRALPTTAGAENAVEAGDYSVPETFSFPADSSNATFPVDIGDAIPNSNSGTVERLTLRLEPNPDADIEVAENWRYFEIEVVQP